MKNVFISHSSHDKIIADMIVDSLESEGISSWIAPRDIPGGSNYGASIAKGLRECKILVLVFSKKSNESDAVFREVQMAFDQKKVIIPFRINDVQVSDDLSFYLSGLHWIDAVQKTTSVDILLKDVKHVLQNLGKRIKHSPSLPEHSAAFASRKEKTGLLKKRHVFSISAFLCFIIFAVVFIINSILNDDAGIPSIPYVHTPYGEMDESFYIAQDDQTEFEPLQRAPAPVDFITIRSGRDRFTFSTREEVLNLNGLFLQNAATDLLHYMRNLVELDLGMNYINDFTFLSDHPNLTRLHMSSMGLDDSIDFTPLATLSNLVELNISWNLISDLSFLTSLTNLVYLNLSGNHVSDLSFLEGLTNLVHLDLSRNHVSDLSFLEGLTNLVHLDLSRNHISDLSFLEGLTNLVHLNLSANAIEYFSPLKELPNLISLYLELSWLYDISFLSCFVNLVYLNLSQNNIRNIAPLAELTSLTNLRLGVNDIIDITPLSRNINLTNLSLHWNNISDITSLAHLTNLVGLNLSNNRISDITPLAYLINLVSLDLTNNNINDLSPFSEVMSLVLLFIRDNEITDWSPIAHIMYVVGRP